MPRTNQLYAARLEAQADANHPVMNRFSKAPGFLWLVVPSAVCVSFLVWSLPSPLIAKKVLAYLMLPAGLAWLGLMAIACLPGLKAWGRRLAIAVLVFYTLAGNAWFGGWLLGKLEFPYVVLSQSPEPFDAICVLGGGSSASPDGTAQLGPSGDRLIVPARLYLAGKTKRLVASGLSVTDIGGERSLADDTAAIWLDLGIPDSAIIRLSVPRTTSEEIREFRKLIVANSWKRVGVCSSAWHLRRVGQLCRKEGLKFSPVPCDFLSGELPWSPMYAIPQARGFQNVQKALWEYLGGLAGG